MYQIYPHSFKDSNGDGIGDLPGALSKLDYLQNLGVDVVWFSPLYVSPLKDMGYDIADYYEINPLYGSMDDWQKVCDGLHERGMRLMMDLVVNHCSSENDLFKDSVARKNGKDDWFIWRDAKKDKDGTRCPPNNWGSAFSGSAWEWSDERRQYYLHMFEQTQPDFNWENVDVRTEVHKIMKFWMDKGCDGFRMDVINMISKTPGLPDAPSQNPGDFVGPGQLVFNGPHVHEYLHELNKEVYAKYDPVINVGECPAVTPDAGLKYVARAREELKMIFQFEHTDIDLGPGGKFTPKSWKLTDFKEIMNKWQHVMQDGDGWNSLYLENHDQPRSISRYADDSPEFRDVSARGLAVFHVSLAGTPYIYQGQELGMTNRKEWPLRDCRDVETINYYEDTIEKRSRKTGKTRDEIDMSDVIDQFQKKSRDNARTPMHWNAEKYAGFSTSEPWIPMMNDYEEYNAANQVDKSGSHYEWFKAMLKFRKDNQTLIYGMFESVDQENEKIYAFTRTDKDRKLLIVCNFTSTKVKWTLPKDLSSSRLKLLISSYKDTTEASTTLSLEPRESRIYDLTK